MKSLITPLLALIVIAIAGALAPDRETLVPTKIDSYAFDPAKVRRNICGPIGSKRAGLFRPELAQLFSKAVMASDKKMSTDVPLFSGLDHRKFPISSGNKEAQAYFQQGFALLYGFNHWEAIRAFKKAQEADPNCAICFWGEAIALGPNINAPMTPEANASAVAAIQTANALKNTANERERALIEAALNRYAAEAGAERGNLDQQYAEAMASVSASFPDDQDIATLYAEAIMDTSPWDYWERDFSTPRPHIKVAIDTINAVLAENPDHYGAIHLFIHLYEASDRANEAAGHADKLAALVPGSGHLVHMPGHIYFRIGRYLDSLDTNITAVAVDEAYLNATTGSPIYRYGYYPHNVHFVLVSAQMAEDEKTSMEYAAKLDSLIPMEVLAEAGWIAPIKVAPYYAYAQFASVQDVEALPDPGNSVPYVKAIWHYARGKVFAENGDPRAVSEMNAIADLMEAAAKGSPGVPTDVILSLAHNTISAKIKMRAGDYGAATDLLRENIKLQDSMSYTEPPFWYYAVEQSLGAALYMDGKYTDAEMAFKSSLVRHPNSAGSLYGLWQTQKKLGLNSEAEYTRDLFKKAQRGGNELSFIKL